MGAPSTAPFVGALMLGAFLLFWQQPMVARLLLPGLGGAPAVWAVCLVFFQAALLAGYAYAHLARIALSPRAQASVHVLLLVAAGATLPIALDTGTAPPSDAEPASWLLTRLAMAVAPSFVVAAATAPLLQGWFATSGRDPYFLYAASNIGSFAALVLFPVALEPSFDLTQMKLGWAIGYGGLVLLTLACAWSVSGAPVAADPGTAPTWRMRFLWLALAFVPSALLVGVTNHISTDVAAVPLLWVVPLALYLLSFVNAFAARPWVTVNGAAAAVVVLLALVATASSLGWGAPHVTWQIARHCLALFAFSLALHGRLALLRPPSAELTTFYLWMALGGALGGSFAALAAPVLFDSVLEYPLMVVAACLLLPGRWPELKRPFAALLDIVVPGLMVLALVYWPETGWQPEGMAWALLLLMLTGLFRPLRMGLAATVAFLGHLAIDAGPETHLRSRSFFGVHLVRDEGLIRVLRHGTTLHGGQSQLAARKGQPLAYYHPLGPAGTLLMAHGGTPLTRKTGVVGLGVGALARYADPGEDWTFFEIDREIIRISRDTGLFTLLADAPVSPRIVAGDARIRLADEPDGSFTLLIIDAFSSDAIPMHLLTEEAFRLYRRKLMPGGVLLMNVTNRHLLLEPVVARAGALLGMVAMAARDNDTTALEAGDWKAGSEWVLLSSDPAALDLLKGLPHWREAIVAPGPAWTDQYSNLIEAIRR